MATEMTEANAGVTGGSSRASALAGATGIDPLRRAVAVMELLRSEEGCPWDREQTFDSIKRHTLEETYEVFDAIERRDWADLRDELGDLLLQVLFYAQMASEAGHFGINDVAGGLVAKLIRRHPHVFPAQPEAALVSTAEAGEASTDSGAVLRNWEQIKRAEKRARGVAAESLLAAVPRTMPAMVEASKLGAAAAKVGFDWPDADGVLRKLREEADELEAELRRETGGMPAAAEVSAAGTETGGGERGGAAAAAIEEEFGDLLFTAMNLGRRLRLDSESALRRANAKFRARFGAMEVAAGGVGAIEAATPEQMEAMWAQAKRSEG